MFRSDRNWKEKVIPNSLVIILTLHTPAFFLFFETPRSFLFQGLYVCYVCLECSSFMFSQDYLIPIFQIPAEMCIICMGYKRSLD